MYSIFEGCDLERAAPEAYLLRPVRTHHSLDALQGGVHHVFIFYKYCSIYTSVENLRAIFKVKL
jgi:hypothetical protein